VSATYKTAIVAATDRGYLPAACCVLTSAWRRLPADHEARLFLVCCDVDKEDVAEANRFFASKGVACEILQPTEVADRIKPIGNRWPRAAYLRLYFDSIFSDEYERLVYLDADMRVCAPLAPLMEAELGEGLVGAAHDFIYYVTGNIRRRRRDLFLSEDAPYLQSGVMVFDWRKTLADDVLGRARAFLEANPERCLEAPDQDALNAALEGKWTPIDPRWNLHELYLTFGGVHAPYIEHYTSTKPWSRLRPKAWRAAAAWYREELRGSAWEAFVANQTLIDRMEAWARFQRFFYAPKLRDALAGGAPFLLRAANIPLERDETKELPWAPKNRRDVEIMTEALIEEAAGTRPRILPPESALA